MSSFGLTENGFIKKDAATIKTEFENDLKAAYGALIDLEPESFFGNLVGIVSERESLIWDLSEAVYFSAYPDTAQGVNLDNASTMTGISRINEKFSTETVMLGTAGAVDVLIPLGTIVSQSATNQNWQTLAAVTIPAGGTIPAIVEATDPGPIDAPAGTIDNIVTVIAGFDSVTNAGTTILGRLQETDPELRLRRSQSIVIAKGGTMQAVANRLLNEVPGVTFVSYQENRTDIIDSNGLLPHSYLFTVVGGTDQNIADLIFIAKSGGINTNGTTAVIVTDEFNIEHVIRFNRALQVNIYYILNLEVNANYPANGDDLVKNALIEYGKTLINGQTVKYWESIAALDNFGDIPGIDNVVLFLGLAPAPAGQVNIPIDINDVAWIQEINITVNQV